MFQKIIYLYTKKYIDKVKKICYIKNVLSGIKEKKDCFKKIIMN